MRCHSTGFACVASWLFAVACVVCTAPAHGQNTRAGGVRATPSAQGPIVGLHASRVRQGALVAWSNRHVLRSFDDGATWRRILTPNVEPNAVAIGDDGTVHVVLAVHELRSIAPDGTATRTAMPFARRTSRLLARGRWIAWVGETHTGARGSIEIALSSDRGRQWQNFAPRDGNEGFDIDLESDGTIHWMSASEAACGGGAQWLQHHRPGAVDFADGTWSVDSPGAWALGARGVGVGVIDGSGAAPGGVSMIALVEPTGPRTVMPYASNCPVGSFSVVRNDHVTLVRSCERLAVVDAAHSRIIDASLGQTLVLTDVDRSDRALGIVVGAGVRRDADGIWRVIVP